MGVDHIATVAIKKIECCAWICPVCDAKNITISNFIVNCGLCGVPFFTLDIDLELDEEEE